MFLILFSDNLTWEKISTIVGVERGKKESERETFRIFVGIFVIWLQIFLLFSSFLLPFSPVHFRSYVVFSN